MQAYFRSFVYAFRGVYLFLRTERNARLHSIATVAAIGVGVYLGFELTQWSMIAIAIGLVWMAELFNTAIERLADAVTLDESPLIRDAKDVSAGAVLIASLTAATLGLIVILQQLKIL